MLRRIEAGRIDPNGAGGDGEHGLFGLDLSADESSVVLLAVPWDATTSYGAGASLGPEAIRRASRQIDLYDPDFAELGLASPWRFGIHMRPTPVTVFERNVEARRLAEPMIEQGGADDAPELKLRLERVNSLSVETDDWVKSEVESLLLADRVVGVVGGDHSVALGAIAAQAERHPDLGLLHVDAHADLRRAYQGFERSHASILDNVLRSTAVGSVTQVAIRDLCDQELEQIRADDRVTTFFDRDLARRRFAGEAWGAICADVVATLPETVYVTFDIDGLDPTLCPHTGTPVPGGLRFDEAVHLLLSVARSGRRVIGFDLTEVAPSSDDDDEWDGNVGARLLYRLCALTLHGHGARDQ